MKTGKKIQEGCTLKQGGGENEYTRERRRANTVTLQKDLSHDRPGKTVCVLINTKKENKGPSRPVY